jgi:dihydrolipoamide dehydrogenase
MEIYDVIVIGAGPAGYVAAIRASQLKQKVAIVDQRWLGGVCLNVGCIPSKALLRNAEIAQLLRERGKDFGFSFDHLKLDYPAAVKRSRQVSERLVKGIGFLMKKNGIAVQIGKARCTVPDGVSVTDKEGREIDLKARNIILATGASAMLPPAWKVDGRSVITYQEAILQEKLPKAVIIIGAGAIGMEFATIWSSYGVEVTVVEMLPHILPLEEEEAAAEVAKSFGKRGVRILAGTKVESVEARGDGVRVNVSAGGQETVLEAEQALVAVGFQPNSHELGVEQLGVKLSKRGFIEIDDRMATNVPGIWAIGDVTGKLMLAHVGSAMGIVCAENISGAETVRLDYEMMPRATYCSPQVASFGISEAQARERGMAVKVGRFPFQANGKALGLGDYAGWVKLVTEEKYGEILGATLVGPEVTELLPELTLAHMLELTAAELARNIHGHPTLSEAIAEAAHVVQGNPIHI